MLVLTRRIGETIVLGDGEVRITVLAVNGGQVKLGVKADESISIHREEIYQRIEQGEAFDKPSQSP